MVAPDNRRKLAGMALFERQTDETQVIHPKLLTSSAFASPGCGSVIRLGLRK